MPFYPVRPPETMEEKNARLLRQRPFAARRVKNGGSFKPISGLRWDNQFRSYVILKEDRADGVLLFGDRLFDILCRAGDFMETIGLIEELRVLAPENKVLFLGLAAEEYLADTLSEPRVLSFMQRLDGLVSVTLFELRRDAEASKGREKWISLKGLTGPADAERVSRLRWSWDRLFRLDNSIDSETRKEPFSNR